MWAKGTTLTLESSVSLLPPSYISPTTLCGKGGVYPRGIDIEALCHFDSPQGSCLLQQAGSRYLPLE